MNSKSNSKLLAATFSGWGLSWRGLIDNRKGDWWLIAQLVLLALHLLPCWPAHAALGITWPEVFNQLGALIFLIGVFMAIRSLLHLGPSLSPLPDPKPGAELKTTGAYKLCRHPLYQALIICSTGLMIFIGSLLHLLLLISLCFILKGKATREEKKLLVIHPMYQSYIENTVAIIPKVAFLDWRTSSS